MKKKLEADLMSIAHRVLQIKNKSDINQLYIETQKLYEKLAILRFVEEHFGGSKPTIGQAEIIEKMKHFFEEIHVSDPLVSIVPKEIIVDEIVEEEIISNETEVEDAVETENEEIVIDEVPEIVLEEEEELKTVAEEENEIEPSKDLAFLPAFELDVETEEETPNKPEEVQISFMDLLGANYSEPTFVKVDQSEEMATKTTSAVPKETNFEFDKEEVITKSELNAKSNEPKTVSLNDKFAKGITIGLNDRIAFVKHLFGNSDEDYNRVMNQLITYDNFEEAQSFIDDMVKPDYNSWEGKEDYSQRFIEIIEKKFA
jgi:hypothetical protein